MGRGAGFHADQARRQRLEELQHLAAPQLLTNDDLFGRVDAMDWNTFLAISKTIVGTISWRGQSSPRDRAGDDPSRVAFVQVMANQRKESAVTFLEAAVAYFAKLGICIEHVMRHRYAPIHNLMRRSRPNRRSKLRHPTSHGTAFFTGNERQYA